MVGHPDPERRFLLQRDHPDMAEDAEQYGWDRPSQEKQSPFWPMTPFWRGGGLWGVACHGVLSRYAGAGLVVRVHFSIAAFPPLVHIPPSGVYYTEGQDS